MRTEEIKQACPGLDLLMTSARLDYEAGRTPREGSPALLAALARAAAALGVTALEQIPADQLPSLLASDGDAGVPAALNISEGELPRLHAQLSALSPCELLGLLNFHANALSAQAVAAGQDTERDRLIPAAFTHALPEFLAGLRPGGRVLITDAIAHGPALLRIARRHPQLEFHLEVRELSGSSFSTAAHAAAQFIYQDCPNVTLHLHQARVTPQADSPDGSESWGQPQWDAVVHVPRGMYSPSFNLMSPTALLGTVAMIIYAHELCRGGRILTALPAQLTTSASQTWAALRRHLTDHLCVHELCTAPPELRFDTCPRPRRACLLVLGTVHELPQHLCLSRLERGGDEAQAELCRPFAPLQRRVISEGLPYADFLHLTDWNPRAMEAAARSLQGRDRTALPRERLDQLASIERGTVIRPADCVGHYDPLTAYDDHHFCVISTACLHDGITSCNGAAVAYLPQRDPQDVLDADDILVAIRGSSIKVAPAPYRMQHCIATSNLAVIRPSRPDLVASLYLLLFLQSPPGLELLAGLSDSRRPGQLNIRYRALGSLEIPLPPIEWQINELVNDYMLGLSEYGDAAADFSEYVGEWLELQEQLQQQVRDCVLGQTQADGQGQ